MLKIILLIIAVSTDSFAAAIGTGAAGIKIPVRSAAVISLTGTLFLSCSVAFADLLGRVIPEKVCGIVSSALLIFLGLFNLFQNFFRDVLNRRKKAQPGSKPNPADMFFDSAAADADNSKSISVREALALSVALSADSLVTGVSAGLGKINLPLLSAGAFAAGLISTAAGQWLGRKIVSTLHINLGWLCGTVLIILALLEVRN